MAQLGLSASLARLELESLELVARLDRKAYRESRVFKAHRELQDRQALELPAQLACRVR